MVGCPPSNILNISKRLDEGDEQVTSAPNTSECFG
jgi:hypothetical protein